MPRAQKARTGSRADTVEKSRGAASAGGVTTARRPPGIYMKSRHQRELAQEILSREVGYVRKPHANRLRVALIFPNTYFVGMSNLGFQTIYRLFNDQPDIVCERAFLPPKQELAALRDAGTRIVTLESQTPVGDFDVIAFSVSFEWDYTNVLTMLRLAGVPVRAADRDYTHPLIVIGGAVTFVNPEPLAPFADVIAAGEGEALVPALLDAFGTSSRSEQLKRLAQARGYYIPSFYDVEYDADGTIARFVPREGTGAPPVVKKAALKTHRRRRSAVDDDLHARHRVRLALPRRSRARLREPVPLLLGRLQLPAGPRVSRRSASSISRRRRARTRRAPAWCRSRSAITLRSSTSCAASRTWATRSARRRCASTT